MSLETIVGLRLHNGLKRLFVTGSSDKRLHKVAFFLLFYLFFSANRKPAKIPNRSNSICSTLPRIIK